VDNNWSPSKQEVFIVCGVWDEPNLQYRKRNKGRKMKEVSIFAINEHCWLKPEIPVRDFLGPQCSLLRPRHCLKGSDVYKKRV
jgi:hypothetical protein